MSLESFISLDANQPMSEASFEAFKEKMKKAAAQIAAIKKEEKNHKKKEDELIKILLEFVKNTKKSALTLLISRALEQNIPANFILALILLGNEDIQRKTGNTLLLEAPDNIPDEKALVFFGQDQSLPLKIRIQLDIWLKNLMVQAEETPEKLLKNAYEYDKDKNRTLKNVLPQLFAFVMDDFLNQHKQNEDFDKLKSFARFILEGTLKRTEENYKNRKLLED